MQRKMQEQYVLKSQKVWEQINALYFLVKDGLEKRHTTNDLRGFFTEIKNGCQLVYGMYDATISRNEAWNFGKLGQVLERADKTSRVWTQNTTSY
jgi:uncharacterized alpha-E superfamily protein